MSHVFISYARSTAKEAQVVAAALRGLGHEVWLDDEIPAHRAYADEIEERLREAKAVVVIWSADAVKSEWVRSEADRARGDRKLVQMKVDGAALPMPFDQIQCADMTDWTGNLDAPGWRKVVASIGDLTGTRGGSSPKRPDAVSTARHDEPLLAVLAFDNLSGDPEMAYFSDGVSEEILQTVARSTDMKVIGRGSSFQFRGPGKGAAHVRAVLNATHVLDGSVRRSGSKVRIAANLIECERETTLWSDRFDRELSDVFALQDEIAAAVASALKVAFAPAVQAEKVDPAAFTLYLRARDIRNRGLLSPETVASVIELLQEATTRSPTFARAWEFLATVEAEYVRFKRGGQTAMAVKRRDVAAAAETALKLDPALGAAFQAMGQLEPFGHFAEREGFHLKALAVAPNDPTVLTNASLFFAEVGRMGEAAELARQAYALDPMYPWAASWYATVLQYCARTDEARRLQMELCERWPDNELIFWSAILAAADFGDWPWLDSLLSQARARGFSGRTFQGAIAWAEQMRAPDPAMLERDLQRARRRLARDGDLAIVQFTLLHRFGLTEEAFELIERASFAYMFDPDMVSPNGAEGPAMMFSLTPALAMMHDPRFATLCDKLGLCDYWTTTDRWPDCARPGMLPYDFKAECRRLALARA